MMLTTDECVEWDLWSCAGPASEEVYGITCGAPFPANDDLRVRLRSAMAHTLSYLYEAGRFKGTPAASTKLLEARSMMRVVLSTLSRAYQADYIEDNEYVSAFGTCAYLCTKLDSVLHACQRVACRHPDMEIQLVA